MRHTNTHVYFWRGPFSNWDNCHFVNPTNKIKFLNTETAFMWYKAVFFNDLHIALEIERSQIPDEVKKLGRSIRNFNEKSWDCVRFGFMVYVNYLKYSQNPNYGQMLKNTENKVLVEASPYDKIWGVGLEETDDKILDENNWQGQNLLGKALMEVRKML